MKKLITILVLIIFMAVFDLSLGDHYKETVALAEVMIGCSIAIIGCLPDDKDQ